MERDVEDGAGEETERGRDGPPLKRTVDERQREERPTGPLSQSSVPHAVSHSLPYLHLISAFWIWWGSGGPVLVAEFRLDQG